MGRHTSVDDRQAALKAVLERMVGDRTHGIVERVTVAFTSLDEPTHAQLDDILSDYADNYRPAAQECDDALADRERVVPRKG